MQNRRVTNVSFRFCGSLVKQMRVIVKNGSRNNVSAPSRRLLADGCQTDGRKVFTKNQTKNCQDSQSANSRLRVGNLSVTLTSMLFLHIATEIYNKLNRKIYTSDFW